MEQPVGLEHLPRLGIGIDRTQIHERQLEKFFRTVAVLGHGGVVQEVAGREVVGPVDDHVVALPKLAPVTMRVERAAKVIGIGELGASALTAGVGDFKQFTSGHQFGAWLGLVPSQRGTGGKVKLLGISKRGDTYLRTLLIHGARAVLRVTSKRSDAKSRWGSCSSDGRIRLSWRLILAPPFVLDYLAVHEVAHLIEMNHSRRFWRLVERICPHMGRAKAWLDAHGADLHRYGFDTRS